MHVLDKMHIHQEKQWSDISLETTNKTTGKHWIVHSPFQIRGFPENYRKKKKKRRRRISDLPRPDPHVLAGRLDLCSAWQEWLPVMWRSEGGSCGGTTSTTEEKKNSFRRSIDGYSVPIGSWFPDSCSGCTQVKWVVGMNFMPHLPTKSASVKRCWHYSDYSNTNVNYGSLDQATFAAVFVGRWGFMKCTHPFTQPANNCQCWNLHCKAILVFIL